MIERHWARRTMRAAVLALVLVVGRPQIADARRHDLHVSHTRVVVSRGGFVARIRLFKDDAEKALHRPLKRDESTDHALGDYLNAHLRFRIDGREVAGKLLDAGEERDESGITSWWVMLAYQGPPRPKALGVSNTLLYELYGDQQNLVAVLWESSGERGTLYFQPGDRSEQVLRW